MEKGFVHIICGEGYGKTTVAVGQGIRSASEGKSVIIIQFLKEKQRDEIGFIKRLEPEIKVFRFEKSEKSFEELSEEEQIEERQNLINGVNFARKVLVTEECDVLILDEVLGLIEYGIVSADEIRALIQAKNDETDLILTGISQSRELWDLADAVTEMVSRKKEEG
ncbi:MAG: cob(I)yrinic acid a,c-diamide adenosyltransferase [Blautia sp.]|nr:cob(I)yrinic acid a,c-diamide adenosyltransferase [Blautia sp.]MDY4516076.1 cob(I)yrinic acid a,c-diamide adenosyltransferase [Lachnospiraceae bacterium]